MNHDIAGGTKKPLAVELDEKYYGGLAPYTTYTARTVFIHSLAFNDQLKGLSPERLRFSVARSRARSELYRRRLETLSR